MRKNFSIKIADKEYWISRSVATIVFIFRKKNDKIQILIEQRGKGAADNIGKWCVPGGYLEWDVTLEENAAMEVLQETGFTIKQEYLKLLGVISSPSENHQNVTVMYAYFAVAEEDFDRQNAIGGEKDEVEDVQWLNINGDGKSLLDNSDNWAFNHNEYIKKYSNLLYI